MIDYYNGGGRSMDINYCQVCGEKLILKQIGDEGMYQKHIGD